MNDNFYKRVVERLNSISLEEIQKVAQEFGIILDSVPSPLKATDPSAKVDPEVGKPSAGTCGNETCEECEGFDMDWKPQFKSELRMYAFVNYYLSSIQQGIQTGHAAVDLVRKYANPAEVGVNSANFVKDWADNHKTFITLNGGNNKDLHNLLELTKESGYPWVAFHEDEDSLGGIMTAVAVVLPDNVFNLQMSRNESAFTWTRYTDDGGVITHIVDKDDPLFKFVEALKSKGLAK